MGRRPAPPRPEVFLDASFIIGLIDTTDDHHAAAERWAARYAARPVLTTTVMLTESCDKRPTRERWRTFDGFLTKLRADPLVTIVPVDAARIDQAADLRRKNLTRKWGLADCISFIVMREHGIDEALSADAHFNEAGFDALLLRS